MSEVSRRDATRASSGAAGWQGWVLLSPFLLCFCVFSLWPLINAARLATQQTYGPGFSRFVGLENFSQLLHDPMFWTALKNTSVFTLLSVLVQMPLALGLAMLLNRPGLRGRGVMRLVLFSPVLVGVVFTAMIFAVLLEKRTGLINIALHHAIGWDLDFAWLERGVMSSLVLATAWQYTGFNMVYFLAALQTVPEELKQAARLDGAGPWARFRHVTLPAIRPVAMFVVLLCIIGSFQIFELPYILLNGGAGPDNRGLTLVMYLYQTGFQTGDLGYAAAIGWMIALILATFGIVQRVLASRHERMTGGSDSRSGGAR